MSENRSMSPDAVASPRLNSMRLDQLRRAPALKVIGLPELIGLAGAALLALLVIFSYFYFYLPARSRLTSAESDRARLQALRQTYGITVTENESTRESDRKSVV